MLEKNHIPEIIKKKSLSNLERLLDSKIGSDIQAIDYLNELSEILDYIYSNKPFISNDNPDVIGFYPETLRIEWKGKYKNPPHDETYQNFIDGIEARKNILSHDELLKEDELLKKIESNKNQRLTSIKEYNEYLSLLIQLIKKAERLLRKDNTLPYFSFPIRPLNEYITYREMTAEKIKAYQPERKQNTEISDSAEEFFLSILKNDYKTCYKAFCSALKDNLIEKKSDGIFNFRCKTGAVAWFFRDSGYTEWKTIRQYVESDNKKLPESIASTSAYTKSKEAKNICKKYFN